jgi:hypothetical protein
VSEISLEINNYKKIALPIRLQEGQRLQYRGGEELLILDAQWNRLKSLKVSPLNFRVKTGGNSLNIDCKFDVPETEAALKLEIKTLGKRERVTLKTTIN